MFYSILFPDGGRHERPSAKEMPECFRDLNLDQIFTPLLERKKRFGLDGLFFTSLREPEVIRYRQDVMRDLENEDLFALVSHFSEAVFDLDWRLEALYNVLGSEKSYENNYLARGRMLYCAELYCKEVTALSEGLRGMDVRSSGLRSLAGYLDEYRRSDFFVKLEGDIGRLRYRLDSVSYNMLINNGQIRVRKYEGQPDLSAQVIEMFDKFRRDGVKDYRKKLSNEPVANHVEAAVLNMVAKYYRDIFAELDAFCESRLRFQDAAITRFAGEVQFYIAWLDHIRPLRAAGLHFNYPHLSETAEHLYNYQGFDLALALKKQGAVVTNDFVLEAPERIIVVTGPNQGGKTTFARAFGQLHWLMSLGLCVPGSESALYLFDGILTHFGREEDLSTLNGKLQDDLVRLRELLDKATSGSVIIVNEIFSSTTLSDALVLGERMMDAFAKLGAPAVVVTFLDELARRGEETVSMMSTVKEEDPSQRTYKIIRKPPDGLAYAMHIAGRHGLTYEQLSRRLKA